MVPSEPAGCRQSLPGAVPLAGHQQPENPPRTAQGASLERPRPLGSGAHGPGPAPGPAPCPPPLRAPRPLPGPGHGPEGGTGTPAPPRLGVRSPGRRRASRREAARLFQPNFAACGGDSRSECRFHREHGSPLRGRTLQEREARVPTVTEKLRLARETD